jgi:hypothetical protein
MDEDRLVEPRCMNWLSIESCAGLFCTSIIIGTESSNYPFILLVMHLNVSLLGIACGIRVLYELV